MDPMAEMIWNNVSWNALEQRVKELEKAAPSDPKPAWCGVCWWEEGRDHGFSYPCTLPDDHPLPHTHQGDDFLVSWELPSE
jgi:hypothetical protein